MLTREGEYAEKFINQWGCDSVVVFGVTTVDVSVEQDGNYLWAMASDATDQWLDCDQNFMPIMGAVNQLFVPDCDGWYAVQVTQKGCIALSKQYQVMGVGTGPRHTNLNFRIYPNPSRDGVWIEVPEAVTLEFYNFQGQRQWFRYLSPGKYYFDLNDHSARIYYVSIFSANVIIGQAIIRNP